MKDVLPDTAQSAKEQNSELSKCNICTLNYTLDCTLEEQSILEFLKTNPQATQKEIAAHIQKSERTVKTITNSLQQKNLIERVNGKRNGYWLVKEVLPNTEN